MPGLIASLVSEKDYLANPDYKHCEYFDGEVVELNLGSKPHSRIQVRCASYLMNYCDRHGGAVYAEQHCRLQVGDRLRYMLPDVGVVLNDATPDALYLDRAPDLVVEIRSPEDSIVMIHRKMATYFENGAQLGWIVLPEEKSVLVLTPTAPVQTKICGESLDGGAVLPGFELAVDELFR